ncbi:RagB/SusD family nutrient uptake outer membrane protein [Robertkochia solimangrovi]|uniref:RagB/SusD family nutrient uptake outer membrane protein n=1 Tax=Robertkochia solimangrovi TaxID=2213046 RepID=UPI00118069E3|nr:RagB/SusD family nutrient uptake outer membrane protein [Robertkochia solimangrovi]TRZ42495.1 RagB/SusD family nutrient uptake outer membrane protein [Robertkochia solimangrovi]
MKTIKLIATTAMVSSLILFTGCSDIVDLDPDGSITTDLALSTVEGLEGSILGVYERGRSPYESNDLCMYRTAGTDIIMGGTNLSDQAIARALSSYDFELSPDNQGVLDVWNAYYTALNRANIIIKNVDSASDVNPDDANQVRRINTVKGEAYFFRAYFHFNLIKRWDNIVLVMDAPEVVSNEAELADPAEVWAAIVSDLETAIPLLPSTVNSNGRVSKAVARHMFSKVLMWLGRYDEAAAQADQVINDGNYMLEPLDVIFSTQHEENREILLAWQFDQSDVDHPSRTCQQYFPLYDRVNGVARTFDQGGRPWARLAPNSYYFTLFDEADGRLDAWHKRFWYYDDAENLPAGVNLGDVVTTENISGGVNPLYITPTTAKYQEDGYLGRQLGDAQGYKNVIQYRLSEAYLVAAEANMRGSGGEAKALTYINVLRQRAYGDSSHNLTSLNQDIFLEEHARELGHEGHRWDLLKRLGVLVERVREYNPDAGLNIQDFHVRWPIPRSFVSLTGVAQNPSYN